MKSRRNSADFIHIFGIFDQILLKYIKIVNCSNNNFISTDRGKLLNCSIRVFCLELKLNISKFRLFVKMRPNLFFFSPLALNLLERDTLKLRHTPLKLEKGLVVLPLALGVIWI